jgi:hypothetical protein
MHEPEKMDSMLLLFITTPSTVWAIPDELHPICGGQGRQHATAVSSSHAGWRT